MANNIQYTCMERLALVMYSHDEFVLLLHSSFNLLVIIVMFMFTCHRSRNFSHSFFVLCSWNGTTETTPQYYKVVWKPSVCGWRRLATSIALLSPVGFMPVLVHSKVNM